MSSHPKYRQHHTHPLYDINIAICVASFALYKTSHPHFMTSNHRDYVITPTIISHSLPLPAFTKAQGLQLLLPPSLIAPFPPNSHCQCLTSLQASQVFPDPSQAVPLLHPKYPLTFSPRVFQQWYTLGYLQLHCPWRSFLPNTLLSLLSANL